MTISYDGSLRSVACPSCSALIPVYDPNGCYAGCTNCFTFYSATPGHASLAQGWLNGNDVQKMTFAPGVRARLDNKEYVVTGFLEKEDPKEDVVWKEYMLYNEASAEYVTLAEYNGHWMLIWPDDEQKYTLRQGKSLEGRKAKEVVEKGTVNVFRLYTYYKFRLVSGMGVFDEDITELNNKVTITEYVAAPDIVVTEKYKGDTKWYRGRYVRQKEVAEAFNTTIDYLPQQRGVGIIEPHWIDGITPAINKLTLALVILIILTFIASFIVNEPKNVFNQTYQATKDTSAWGSDALHPVTTDAFHISRDGAVDLTVNTTIDNDWMELTVELVNDKTGESYEFTKLAEYYHGTDGGESWSEGGTSVSGVFSTVPKGLYHVNVFPFSDGTRVYDLGVQVEECTTLPSNMGWFLLLVLGVWIFVYMKQHQINELRGISTI